MFFLFWAKTPGVLKFGVCFLGAATPIDGVIAGLNLFFPTPHVGHLYEFGNALKSPLYTYPQSMHTIGCPAGAPCFFPKLKKPAWVWTTDPRPPVVLKGVRDLDAYVSRDESPKRERDRHTDRQTDRERDEREREFICMKVGRVTANKKWIESMTRKVAIYSSRSKKAYRKHVSLDQEVRLHDKCAGRRHFYA